MTDVIRDLLLKIATGSIKDAIPLTESIFQYKINQRVLEEARLLEIEKLMKTKFFSVLGKEYIQNKMDSYITDGVVPTERINLSNPSANKIPLNEKELEEAQSYIFKFVDKDVKAKASELLRDDQKTLNKLNKHYKGLYLKPVVEDSEQINGTLLNWFALKNKKSTGVPSSIRNKMDFGDLAKKVNSAMAKLQGTEKRDTSNPDANIPEGFSFVTESGSLRLYKWHSLGTVCDLDPKVKKDWMSIVINISGESDNSWCVGKSSSAQDYGYEGKSGSGKFDYPYYMVREKTSNGWSPKYLLHGNSKQAKDADNVPMTVAMADEVMGGLISIDLLEKIYEGTE